METDILFDDAIILRDKYTHREAMHWPPVGVCNQPEISSTYWALVINADAEDVHVVTDSLWSSVLRQKSPGKISFLSLVRF